jgi:hypothetical protein
VKSADSGKYRPPIIRLKRLCDLMPGLTPHIVRTHWPKAIYDDGAKARGSVLFVSTAELPELLRTYVHELQDKGML